MVSPSFLIMCAILSVKKSSTFFFQESFSGQEPPKKQQMSKEMRLIYVTDFSNYHELLRTADVQR